MTLDELLARYEVEQFDRHSTSADRRHAALRELRGLAASLGGRSLLDLTPSDLMAWQGSESKRGIAPTTAMMRESMVHVFVTWAAAVGLLTPERAALLKALPPVLNGSKRSPPKPYKRAEIEQFREALAASYPLAPTEGLGSLSVASYLRTGSQSSWERYVRKHARRLQLEAQVSLALEEGLRRLEIYTLTLPQIATDNAAVVVLTAKTEPGIERWREVPYTAHSRACVQEWLDFRRLLAPPHAGPWLHLSMGPAERTSPLKFKYFCRSLERIEGPWAWHRFRHTFATERLRAGMPLEQLQLMMGHADTHQTLGYAQIVNSDVQREADRTELAFERNLGLVVTP